MLQRQRHKGYTDIFNKNVCNVNICPCLRMHSSVVYLSHTVIPFKAFGEKVEAKVPEMFFPHKKLSCGAPSQERTA